MKKPRDRIRPLEDWVVVVADGDGKTEGGLHVPDSAQQSHMASNGARIIAVGPGRWEAGKFIEPRVIVGQHVWPRMGAPISPVPNDGGAALIRERDLAAIIEPDDTRIIS